MQIRKILIPVSNSFFVRNFLRTDGLKIILSSPSVELFFLAPLEKIEYYRREFPFPKVNFLPFPRVNRSERFFKFLETSSISTRTVLMQQYFYFKRAGAQDNYVLKLFIFLVGRLLWYAGKLQVWQKLIRLSYMLVPDHKIRKLLDEVHPDIIFCPTLIYDEYPLAKEAKKKKIRFIGMISSWDNLYSKTFLRVIPDKLLVQTEYLKERAKKLTKYNENKIVVTGVPQYDRYFLKSGISTREKFIKDIGGDPEKKIILYAFSGKLGIDADFKMLEIISDALKKGTIPSRVQVLIRPYPKNDFTPERVMKIKELYGFLVHSSAGHVGSGKNNWEFEDASLKFLADSLAHSDVVISTYSTFFIEAAIFDKPLIAVGFDGKVNLNYWNSARRFFDWDHLSDIGQSGGIKIARNDDDLIKSINTYLLNPSQDYEGRKKIVFQQCTFTDGKSAQRIAEEILK